MEFQDWKEVKWDKRGSKQINESKEEYIRRERQNGRQVNTVKKSANNSNSFNHVNIKKLEADEPEKLKTLAMSVKKRISQKRAEMKLTQEQLAQKINIPKKIIEDYEKLSTVVVPNPNILNKIEKVIGRVRE